jgi:hypothetical protein
MGGSQRIIHCKYKVLFSTTLSNNPGSDEHYRRSPDCPFFMFAGTSAPKAGKGKKTRPSKASRVSTQSNFTVDSEAPSIPDLNESIDKSTMSVLSTVSTIGKGKNARGKAKAARHNKVEEAWGLQPEQSVIVLDEEPEPVKPSRGNKRTSEQISDDRNDREGTAKPEPPAKRRNTRTRNSVAEQMEYSVLESLHDTTEVNSAAKKPAKGGRKRASTTTRSRKNSGASVASLRAAAPDIAAIEAALEAELDKPLSDEDMAPEPTEKPKRGRSKKAATASKAPTRSKKAVEDVVEDDAKEELQEEIVEKPGPEEESIRTKKGRKTKVTKKTALKRESNESNVTSANNVDTVVESSMVTAQAIENDSAHETDASVAGKRTNKGSKRKAPAKGKGKKGIMSKNIEDIVQSTEPPAEDKMDVSAEIAVLNKEIEAEEATAKEPTKAKAKKGKKVAEKAPHLSMPGAFSPLTFREESIEPSFMSAVASDTPPVRINAARKAEEPQAEEMVEVPPEKTLTPTPTPRAAPPLPPRSPARTATPRSVIPRATPASVQEASPTPSAQSSDAENAPPSSKPESVRPPLKNLAATTRVQLNPGTPTRVPLSPSKIGGGLRSQVPWIEVDVDMVFNENTELEGLKGGELDEKERGMTVQEWIYFNAQKAEEELRREGERVVGAFEREGARAMGVLEGIDCV